MNILKQAFLILSTGVIGIASTPLSASAFNFGFSFENELNGGGTVTGIIQGLNEGTGAATSVRILSNTEGFGIGEYIGNPLPQNSFSNSWTVLDGNIVEFSFITFGAINSPPALTDASLFFESDLLSDFPFASGVTLNDNTVVTRVPGVTTEDINLTFTLLEDKVKTVSEPTSVLNLLAISIAGITIKRKQTKGFVFKK